MLAYTNIQNPQWVDNDKTAINCEVDFDDIDGFTPFTANPNDTVEHGRKIYQELIEGKWGVIAEFIDPNTKNNSNFPTAPSGSLPLALF